MPSAKTPKKPDTTAAEALQKHTKAALKIKPAAIIPCRADVALAYANVRTGVTAVFGDSVSPERKQRISDLDAALPLLSTKKVLELPEIARALVLAAQRVAPASTGEVADKLAIVSKHRQPMLDMAEVLARKGLLDKALVAEIRKGTGKLDMAQDGIALVDVYARNAADLAGKHPFAAADFEELREASEWLVENLVHGGARKAPEKPSEAEDLRDRLWTLVVSRHADLRVFGYWRFRDALDERVPKLLSRVSAPRGPAEELPPEPPPGA